MYIHCDASDYGINDEGDECPVAFMSKKLSSAERNYSVTVGECLAAVEAIERFRCYLELQEFEVITDHSLQSSRRSKRFRTRTTN